MVSTILESIVAARRGHLDEIRARIADVDPLRLHRSTRSLEQALGRRGGANFIMECKSSSPSLGMIREDYKPGEIARVYSRYAAGISVLCEPDRFGGDYDHLATVAASTHLPVLCKDFIIDEVQIHAARYYGADAILLMLSVLNDDEYTALSNEAARLGLDVLTEVISVEEVERAKRLGARIFGVNNRNLHDLSIDLNRTAELHEHIPTDAVLVSESGIRDNRTVRELSRFANGFLVGSQLTGQPDVDLAARTLAYGTNKVCGLTSPGAAQMARAAGATHGGIIIEPASARNVSRETLKKLIHAEPGLAWVAVSRRQEGWEEIVAEGFDVLQLHAPYQGSIAAELEFIESVRQIAGEREIWRAVSMTNAGPAVAEALVPHVDKLVLDTGEGGTGQTFDWTQIPESVKPHALLAGGITAENAADALATGCSGLDINSGAEYAPGKKDAAKVRAIFETIRHYNA